MQRLTRALGESAALAALIAGALAIGSAGIFVRVSETGPTATAFWRGALALPALALWALLERRACARGAGAPTQDARAPGTLWDARFGWCGLFFAADLFVWHWSLLETSVAAATLEANLAPVVVTGLAWILGRERPRPLFLAALALAFAGLVLVVAPKLGGDRSSLRGDLLGVLTAFFYAGYLLAVARVRAERGTGELMLWSTLVLCGLLLPLALLETFLPVTPAGWTKLLALALIAQFLGQGLIAWALAHLPASFGAVALYVQPLAAAVYAWLWLGERLAPVQLAGGAVVLGAIALARVARPC